MQALATTEISRGLTSTLSKMCLIFLKSITISLHLSAPSYMLLACDNVSTAVAAHWMSLRALRGIFWTKVYSLSQGVQSEPRGTIWAKVYNLSQGVQSESRCTTEPRGTIWVTVVSSTNFHVCALGLPISGRYKSMMPAAYDTLTNVLRKLGRDIWYSTYEVHMILPATSLFYEWRIHKHWNGCGGGKSVTI